MGGPAESVVVDRGGGELVGKSELNSYYPSSSSSIRLAVDRGEAGVNSKLRIQPVSISLKAGAVRLKPPSNY